MAVLWNQGISQEGGNVGPSFGGEMETEEKEIETKAIYWLSVNAFQGVVNHSSVS